MIDKLVVNVRVSVRLSESKSKGVSLYSPFKPDVHKCTEKGGGGCGCYAVVCRCVWKEACMPSDLSYKTQCNVCCEDFTSNHKQRLQIQINLQLRMLANSFDS